MVSSEFPVHDDARDARLATLREWAAAEIGAPDLHIVPASSDASFRRYFRLTPPAPWRGHATVIAMDAPPPMEDCRPFVHVAELMRAARVHAPEVLAQDLARGFLLLSDLGNTTYLAALDETTARPLYLDA